MHNIIYTYMFYYIPVFPVLSIFSWEVCVRSRPKTVLLDCLGGESNFSLNGMSDILRILTKPQTSFNLLAGCRSLDSSPFFSV